MTESMLTEISALFLALSDKTRLRLIGLMAGGEVTVGFLADSLAESQPKVSRHLAYLRNAGLVATRREGKNVYYGIAWPTEKIAAGVLQEITGKEAMSLRGEDNTLKYISVEADVSDLVPQEIEIYLL